ncbi:MAG: tetratricopeptide repeat protein [Anaerolineae bacterium]|nr:tetratricopeptide repeat protein [Anaerolineae bacterium]
MTDTQQANLEKLVAYWQQEAQAAKANNENNQLVLALASLGLTHFRLGNYEPGLQAFDEALAVVERQNDTRLLIKALGVKALAYQEIKRFHDAYEAVEDIMRHADTLNDPGLKSDALTTQAQILVQAGEPIVAGEKLHFAYSIARKMGDKRRQMHVAASMSNVSLALTSLDEAATSLELALDLAREIDDSRAALDFQISLGAVLIWQDRFAEAIAALEQALSQAEALQLPNAQLVALRHLTDCYAQLNNAEQVLIYAQRGLALARLQDDAEVIFSLLEAVALAAYRQEDPQLARQTLLEGIELARSTGNRDREVSLLVSLGEANLVGNYVDEALDAYLQAYKGAQQLQRFKDMAYLTGRLGVVYAEQGRYEEARRYHQEAIDLARVHDLPRLEGEQLCMLALALLEQGVPDQALEYCKTAVSAYAKAGDEEGKIRARQLLDSIVVAIQEDQFDN